MVSIRARGNALWNYEMVFHPIPRNTSLMIAKTKYAKTIYKPIAIRNGRLVISDDIDCVDTMYQNFLLNMDYSLHETMQTIVDYNTDELSGHLVLFNINNTLMYCTQRYPSEQHLGMV